MIYRLCWFLLMFGLLAPVRGGAADASSEKRLLRVAIETGWPPMELLDGGGRVVGFTVDYMDAVAREGGFAVSYVTVDWDRMFSELEAGRVDVIASSVSITPARQRVMDFSLPYYEVQQAVVTPAAASLRDGGDVSGMRLAAQVGTTGFDTAMRFADCEVRAYEKIEGAFRALADGEADGVVCDDPVASSYILRNDYGAAGMKVALTLTASDPECYGFAVGKGNAAVLALLNAGIVRVQEKGLDTELRRKWIGY